MTTHKEALTLALEALGWTDEWRPQGLREQAITAAEEVLAQQCVCGEPNSAGTHRTDGPCLAPQRTWVGLTDEEFVEACQMAERGNYLVAFQRIQAKLKEKNA